MSVCILYIEMFFFWLLKRNDGREKFVKKKKAPSPHIYTRVIYSYYYYNVYNISNCILYQGVLYFFRFSFLFIYFFFFCRPRPDV